MRIYALAISLLFIGISHNSWATPVVSQIADFEEPKQLSKWSFSNGAEFPGATGSLTQIARNQGKAAKLSYNIDCNKTTGKCGAYTAAYWKPEAAIDISNKGGISFLAKVPADTLLRVRLTDDTGQTVQYNTIPIGLERPSLGAWQSITIPVAEKAVAFWGGRKDGVFNGKLVSLGIVAVPRNANVPAQGSIAFDDVAIIPDLSTAVDLNRAVAENNIALRVRNRPKFGVSVHYANDAGLTQLAKDAGFTFLRRDLTWTAVEKKPGVYDFSVYDPLAAQAKAKGLGLMWILDYGNALYGGYPTTPAALSAYANYARAAALHYKGQATTFELWNEPDGQGWHLSSQVFQSILQAASSAITSAWPEAIVISGGVSPSLNSFSYHRAAASTPLIKAIGVHTYRDTPETLANDTVLLRSKLGELETANKAKPWNTEWGYSSYLPKYEAQNGDGHSPAARRYQATLAVRQLLATWVTGFPVGVLYDLIDDGTDARNREHNFGLLASNRTPKPSYYAVQHFFQLTQNYSPSGMLGGLPEDVHGFMLSNPAKRLLIVWCDTPGIPHRITLPSNVISVANVLGQNLSKSEPITLDEQSGPIYITFPAELPIISPPAHMQR